jgi:large subunit ribosomal protein L13
MKTVSVTPSMFKKKWLVVDAADQVLGRLSTEISRALLGKTKADYVPYLDNGDQVVVINAEKVKLTGNKLRDKVYFSHSTYIGNLKSASAGEIMAKHPERIIEEAVRGMLPKNKLGKKLFGNMKVYSGSEHPHTAQNPVPLPPRTAQGVK